MPNNKLKSRSTLIAIILICLAPVVVAWLAHKNPSLRAHQSNHGLLITPPFAIDLTSLTAADRFSQNNMNEVKGRWVMMHLFPNGRCNEDCEILLKTTMNIRLMLSKDLTRVRRIAVVGAKMADQEAKRLWTEHPTLLRYARGDDLFDQVADLIGMPVSGNMLFLVDPLGNLMMWYKPGFDPYGVKKDMKKLLDVSQVG